jgi:chromosomal replication initiation ATPase DnaA
MKNITFAADEHLIAAAREQAEADGSTLNEQFRLWLAQYAARRRAAHAMEVVQRVSKRVDLGGRKFTRDELNERR